MGEDEKKKIAELYFGTGEAENGLSKIEEQLIRINKLTENYAKNAKTNYGKNFASNFKANTQTFDIEKLGKGAQKAYFEMQKEAEKTIRKNMEVQKSATSIYDKVADYAKTYLIYQGFNELRQSARELVDEMVNVEYQMVQIDRVLNDSSLNINTYRDRLIQLAYDYGNSFENVADITLRLAQAGFDAQESLALTEKTLLALNTAELNATQATDDMVAIMAQWGLMTGTATEQAESYSEIIDKINITADNFPTTSADIMEAMKKTSSAFKLAGMDIDETIAIIVSAEKASQRGGKAIGTALSNISQQLKTASRIDVAKDLGIDFFKDENKTEYKDLIDILGELSTKMQQLKDDGKESSAEMQKLLEVFTVFRRNIGASLLGEMSGENSTYQQVMNILGDPETIGYSMRENAKHMDTAKAALAQFEAELLKLKTAVWDGGVEDVFRNLLLLGGDISKIMTFLTKTFGPIPVAMGLITLAFATFNKTVKETNVETNVASGNMLKLASNTKVGTAAINKLTLAYKAGTISSKTFKLATIALNTALSFGLSAAITLVASGLDYLFNAEEKVSRKHDEIISELEQEAQGHKELADEVNSLVDAYEKYASMTFMTDDQEKDFEKVQEDMTKFLVEHNKWSAELVNNYQAQLDILKQISEEETKQRIEAEKRTVEEQKQKSLKVKQTPKFNLGSSRWEDIEEAGADMSLYSMGKGGRQFFKTMDIKDQIELLSQWEEQIKQAGNEASKGYEWVSETLEKLKEMSDETDKAIGTLNNDLANTELDKFIDENDIKNAEDFENAVNKLKNISAVPEGWEGDLEDYRSILVELLSQEFPEFQQHAEEIKETFKDAETVLSEYADKLSALQDKYTTLTTAQQELNDSGQINVATFKNMIDQDLLQYLDTTSGKLSINVKAYEALAEAERVAAIQSLQLAAVEDIKNLALGKTEELSGLAQTAINNLGNADTVMGNKAQTAAGQVALMNQQLANTIAIQSQGMAEDVAADFTKSANAIASAYSNIAKYQIPKIGLAASKASRGATKTFEQQSQERIKIFKQEIDEYESLEKAWVNKYKKLELFGTSDLKFITHQRINRYNDYLNQIRNLTGISEEDRTDLLREYTSKRQELELEYFDLLKDQLEDQIDALEKANDEKIKLIEEEADAQIEALKKVEDENDRIRQKEEYERKRNELLYGHQGIEYWRQRSGAEAQRALLEAEQELAELDKDWEEKKEGWTLEDQIEEIENARDAQIKAIEEAQEVQIQAWKDAYQAQVNLYAETGQIIYDNSVINAGYLYDAYMSNFVNPLNVKLREISSAVEYANKSVNNISNRIKDMNEYLPGGSKFIGPLTVEQQGGYEAVAAALKDRINSIGKFHGGGLVNTASEEALAIVRKNEVVLRPEWAAGLDKLVQQINNGGTLNNTSTNTNVNVYGNLANFDAIKVNERKDVANIEKIITQVLKDKFNINK